MAKTPAQVIAALLFPALLAAATSSEIEAPDFLLDYPPGESSSREKAAPWSRPGADVVSGALQKTVAVLAKAGAAARPADRNTFQRMSEALAAAKIEWPAPGRQFPSCLKDERQAYVIYRTREIRICHDAVFNRPPVNYLVQILVHEAAHLLDIRGECEATRLEILAMRLSGEGIEFRNAYMSRCGLD